MTSLPYDGAVIRPGSPHRPGATVDGAGVNFTLRAPAATAAVLRLYHRARDLHPALAVELDPREHFDDGIWHVHVSDVGAGTFYTWSLDGPDDTARTGRRYDPAFELLDPYARLVDTTLWQREAHEGVVHPPRHQSMRAVVLDPAAEAPVENAPLSTPLEDAVIYEVHVGGFTRHPSAGVKHPGTYLGVAEKIPYLKSLGVTHVELLPVFAFDEQEVPAGTREAGLSNYWGYSTHSFFAPHGAYATEPLRAWSEFRQMVHALHRAGIGVILDVVLNHTAEGGADGAVLNFKGLGNEYFYMLDGRDRSRYLDYTGCGNTVNANHHYAKRFFLDCLRYWVEEMHVDGFRFDMASSLTRDGRGEPSDDAPLVHAIELEPTLSETHLIAEAWDAAGLYQVGRFPGLRWAEWNGAFRDCVRRFVHGEGGCHGELAARLAGSADLYQASGRRPRHSINFITCHDGFTLADLVSYSRKHNEANGEDNRDGNNHNLSHNHGLEGPTNDPAISRLRARQIRNHLCLLMLSQGVPMLTSGDEIARTQGGNNNPWCQDNEIAWFDWRLTESNGDTLRFVRELIALRGRHRALRRRHFLTGKARRGELLPDIQWHGHRLHRPKWWDGNARELAFTLAGHADEPHLHVVLNMASHAGGFVMPRYPGVTWRMAVNTAADAPGDVIPPALQEDYTSTGLLWAPAHTVLVFEGHRQAGAV